VSSTDIPALYIISSIYFSQKSDLNKKLVLTEKKARNIFCGPSFNRDADLIEIGSTIRKKEDMQYIKDEIMKTIEKIKTEKPDEATLNSAKSNIKYSFAMRIDNPGAIANTIAGFISVGGDPESVNNYYALFDKVTAEDIINTAKKYFVETGLTIGTISSDDNAPVK
jgi:zinc protease